MGFLVGQIRCLTGIFLSPGEFLREYREYTSDVELNWVGDSHLLFLPVLFLLYLALAYTSEIVGLGGQVGLAVLSIAWVWFPSYAVIRWLFEDSESSVLGLFLGFGVVFLYLVTLYQGLGLLTQLVAPQVTLYLWLGLIGYFLGLQLVLLRTLTALPWWFIPVVVLSPIGWPGILLVLPLEFTTDVNVGLVAFVLLVAAYWFVQRNYSPGQSFVKRLLGSVGLSCLTAGVLAAGFLVPYLTYQMVWVGSPLDRPPLDTISLERSYEDHSEAAEENFRQFLNFVREHDELSRFSDSSAREVSLEHYRNHSRALEEFQDLLSRGDFAYPDDPSRAMQAEHTGFTTLDGPILGAGPLLQYRADQFRHDGNIERALNLAEFIVSSSETMLRVQWTSWFRVTGYRYRRKGLKILRDLVREEPLTRNQLETIRSLLVPLRSRNYPYREIILGESRHLTNDESAERTDRLAEETIEAIEEFMVGQRAATKKTLLWLSRKRSKPYYRTESYREAVNEGNLIVNTNYATLLGYYWLNPHGSIFQGMIGPGMVTFDIDFRHRAESKTRINCLLLTVDQRLRPEQFSLSSLPKRHKLNYRTGEVLSTKEGDGCLSNGPLRW